MKNSDKSVNTNFKLRDALIYGRTSESMELLKGADWSLFTFMHSPVAQVLSSAGWKMNTTEDVIHANRQQIAAWTIHRFDYKDSSECGGGPMSFADHQTAGDRRVWMQDIFVAHEETKQRSNLHARILFSEGGTEVISFEATDENSVNVIATTLLDSHLKPALHDATRHDMPALAMMVLSACVEAGRSDLLKLPKEKDATIDEAKVHKIHTHPNNEPLFMCLKQGFIDGAFFLLDAGVDPLSRVNPRRYNCKTLLEGIELYLGPQEAQVIRAHRARKIALSTLNEINPSFATSA